MRFDLKNGCPASLPGTSYFDLPCMDFRGSGALYRIFVHVPDGEPPADGWPVLYMTDGNAVIATAADALRAQASYPKGTNVCQGMIVAIGYPTDDAYDPLRRSWDLSPPPGAEYPPFFENTPVVRTGGADQFLDFLLQTIRPWLEQHYPIDRASQTLFGHSFGGLFALYALSQHPDAFRNWVAASPAIYWEDGIVRTCLDRMDEAAWGKLTGRVLLSAGAYESDVPAPFEIGREDEEQRLSHRRKIRTVGLAEELAAEIVERTGRSGAASFELFAGENHMSVLPVAVNRAVQTAFDWAAGQRMK